MIFNQPFLFLYKSSKLFKNKEKTVDRLLKTAIIRTKFKGKAKLARKSKLRDQLKHQVFFAEIAQLVEHNLAKVGVGSSSLLFRSISSLTSLE